MIEGVLRHCTEMNVERQYVDSHGQSDVAFGLTHLLGIELMPRLKAIASQKLYRPVVGRPDDYRKLQPILTRPINWDLIRQQYDEMVKYATALRLGTADSEVILKRFMRSNRKHPTQFMFYKDVPPVPWMHNLAGTVNRPMPTEAVVDRARDDSAMIATEIVEMAARRGWSALRMRSTRAFLRAVWVDPIGAKLLPSAVMQLLVYRLPQRRHEWSASV